MGANRRHRPLAAHDWHGRLTDRAHQKYLCGRGPQALDELVMQHFAAEFQAKYGIDALTAPRPTLRLRQASEKARRVLSANSEAVVSLDCLVGETDVHGTIGRSDFEGMAEPLLGRAQAACEKALRDAALEPSELAAVELVGGCSRTPSFVRASRAMNAAHAGPRDGCYARAPPTHPEVEPRPWPPRPPRS